ncbi:MAG: glycogen debranching protein [Chloroflexi bacterium]|nr:glycogen debranching protein [Chloroflexota bacterium]
MMIDFGREVTSDLQIASRREWLVTNGIGGYASGTISGTLTRRYHGLLVAALLPPLGRTVLLSHLDETATYNNRSYPLFTNTWIGDHVDPHGYQHLERFHLEGTIPVWRYAVADALLEKRVWMQPGTNTTYIRYDLQRGMLPLTLGIKAFVNYRDSHTSTHAGDWQMHVEPVDRGLKVQAFPEAVPFYIRSDRADAVPQHTWYHSYLMAWEVDRGLDPLDDHLHAGDFSVTLQPGESVTVVASLDLEARLDGATAEQDRRRHEAALVAQSQIPNDAPLWVQRLALAADQFIVRRAVGDDPDGRSVIAGYHWFGDWGRDTMISLPGLTLVTGRHAEAARVLRTFARYVDQGMLPNRFPDQGETPEYNTVDATLWYFEAIRAYHAETNDDSLLRDLFPILRDIIEWHQRGTRYSIHVDQDDGLLYAGEPGVQLTWMDAKIGDWVVTPRIGKPIEINALWYNALRSMADFARRLGEPADAYDTLADRVRANFTRFWSTSAGYCHDVIDGPGGNDIALRPNQLFAVSLHHSPLPADQQRAVVAMCAQHLLTSYGLRSLAADDPAYKGQYGGSPFDRDSTYHQGTVWSWLIGPFVEAHLRVYGDPALARSFLLPFEHHLAAHGVGSVSEVFTGDAPFLPRAAIAQAWGVAELLRAWRLTSG